MHSIRLPLRLFVLSFGAALIAACSSTPTANLSLGSPILSLPSIQQSQFSAPGAQFRIPALVAVNTKTGALESWPVSPFGGNNPRPFSNPLVNGSGGMAGDGRVVAITSSPNVVIYNIDTKHLRRLPDPFGTPIDIAIDKNETLYAVNIASNSSNVAVYAAGASNPTELMCAPLQTGEAIAVDNEGDVFINGYPHTGNAGVFEIRHGQSDCKQLNNLNTEPGYVAGIAVDPKTDDLVVLDDPDLCAGGIEGRMTIYHKPYSKKTAKSVVIGQNCTGGMRLNADSSIVYAIDQDVSGSYSYILQRSYPDGRSMGAYFGGAAGGFTTIPNTLPN
ncbi:MAG TPA: hypothetical protein VID19_13305 [Candidatus Eremiobacteraceae bacterium]